MEIDLIMLSKLGVSDGGRETWLKNFLLGIDKSSNASNVSFNLITLNKSENCILDEIESNLIKNHKQYRTKYKKIPISLQFIIFCLLNLFFKKKSAKHVLAVGGLEEALATILGYTFKKVRGKKILWLRTIYTKEKGYALNRITQKILLKFEIFIIKNFFDIVIANGDDTAEFYKKYDIDCYVIKNSIDLKKWEIAINKKASNELNIAFIGRLAEVKGIKEFLDAIVAYSKNISAKPINFHVVGDGPFRNDVQDLANAKLLTYYGPISNNELPRFLKNIDCCVALTHLNDLMGGGGVSNALIEQMASKKIMICWDNNIFRHVLNSKECFFVNQGDIHQLALAFLRIYNERELANRMANKSYLVSKSYSIESHINSFFDLIRDS